jgi:hypothetical protein
MKDGKRFRRNAAVRAFLSVDPIRTARLRPRIVGRYKKTTNRAGRVDFERGEEEKKAARDGSDFFLILLSSFVARQHAILAVLHYRR